jgi:hypothetical protein
MKESWMKCCIVMAWCVVGCVAANGDTLADDYIGEVGAYGGAGFGSFGPHGWVGATSGVEVSKYFVTLIDTSYMPLGSHTLPNYHLVTSRSHLYDFNFTVQIQVPLKHKRWRPYALMAGALLFNTFRVETVRIDGVVIAHGENVSKFGFETGGGTRYFVGENWGVRGEYRYTITSRNFSRLLGGIFYQFDGTWPFLPRSKRRSRLPY